MIPLLLIGGGLAFAIFGFAKSKQTAMAANQAMQARTSANTPGTNFVLPQAPTLNSIQGGGPNSSQMVGLGATAYTGAVSAAAASGSVSATSGLVKSLPIVGAIAGIGLGIFGAISAHHQQALRTEGQTLNGADPIFAMRMQQICTAVNTGQITRDQALKLIDDSLAEYDANVAKITNNPGATTNSSKCNAACYIRVNYHLPTIKKVKPIIVSGGTTQIDPIPAHATQSGLPGYTLTVR